MNYTLKLVKKSDENLTKENSALKNKIIHDQEKEISRLENERTMLLLVAALLISLLIYALSKLNA